MLLIENPRQWRGRFERAKKDARIGHHPIFLYQQRLFADKIKKSKSELQTFKAVNRTGGLDSKKIHEVLLEQVTQCISSKT